MIAAVFLAAILFVLSVYKYPLLAAGSLFLAMTALGESRHLAINNISGG